ncbi:MAG: DUF2752 domain-containing protein [Myxococcota bacterium]
MTPARVDRGVLAAAVAVVALAAAMSPSTDHLSLFGWEVPMMCTFRRLTGVSCPGCGLTRSFVFLAHGRWEEAVRMNVLGLPLFGVVLAQIPLRISRLARRHGQPVALERDERGLP